MIYLTIWFLIGVIGPLWSGYTDWKDGRDIPLVQYALFIGAGTILGPLIWALFVFAGVIKEPVIKGKKK